MKPIAFCMLFLATACASIQDPKSSGGFTEIPQELAAVDWMRTPQDVLSSPKEGEPLVWVGQIEEVELKQQEKRVEIGWICRHLRFAEPGPAAVSARPIRVKEGSGYFAVSMIIEGMPIEKAREIQREHTETPHYLMAGGTFCSFIDRHGRKIPFLIQKRIVLGAKLAEFVPPTP